MMVALRRLIQESAWSAVMTILAQARIEANDTASAPPLVMVKREQVLDILSLLEPFEDALQVKRTGGCSGLQWFIEKADGVSGTMLEYAFVTFISLVCAPQ